MRRFHWSVNWSGYPRCLFCWHLNLKNVFPWHFNDTPLHGWAWKTTSWKHENLLAIFERVFHSMALPWPFCAILAVMLTQVVNASVRSLAGGEEDSLSVWLSSVEKFCSDCNIKRCWLHNISGSLYLRLSLLLSFFFYMFWVVSYLQMCVCAAACRWSCARPCDVLIFFHPPFLFSNLSGLNGGSPGRVCVRTRARVSACVRLCVWARERRRKWSSFTHLKIKHLTGSSACVRAARGVTPVQKHSQCSLWDASARWSCSGEDTRTQLFKLKKKQQTNK